ncbi:alpha/beta fold hydrolase [Jannaschia aquimarina]|uniref:Alpha/beta hydrolase family protein n=1 Tax=Jannaschia aquimarina TaxID=935700 RepID=A0A0D1EGQ7_9RHOB|nr:alpha/beta fold hydrolase [Jannaschia aquimarina]KIT15035.1 Alpha/beta hydrolase family protein [Jannaschia aquimarina]SNS62446.1 Serine aminopeptidase, S33 [Jannaschia aquimarina]
MRPAILFAALSVVAVALAVFMLERERDGLSVVRTEIASVPVTIWRPDTTAPLPRVLVVHGYAGSRQMMRAIAITLARSGLEAVTLDLPGHGRNPEPMTGDVTRLDGATAVLTQRVVAVARALADGPDDRLALLGHSMATDIVVRAAESLDPASVVAISMYSEAVTPERPARLLILSGAREGRLRGIALEAARLVEPDAAEDETVSSQGISRRAAVVPVVGHVGVLYAPEGLREVRDWIVAPWDVPGNGRPPATALWLLFLLAGIVALTWPLARAFGPVRPPAPAPSARTAAVALILPIPAAVSAAVLAPDLFGLMAFGPLAAFLAAWGVVQIAVLWRAGHRLSGGRLGAAFLLAAWAILFVLALDRYGASFVLTGPRLAVAAALLPGALLFVYGDALLTSAARFSLRLTARAVPLAALLGAMVIDPPIGVAFTVLPVTVLFWVVFGTAAGWMAGRAGSGGVVPVLGGLLAFAFAASTPIIAI